MHKESAQGFLNKHFSILGKNYFAFLRMNTCFLAFTSIVGIFVNTFLLKASGNTQHVMIYNAIVGGAQPLFMVIAVLAARKLKPRNSQRIGFLIYAVCFIFIMLRGEAAAESYILIGALLSCGAGFYYVTYSLQLVEYTDDSNRDSASGVTNTVSAIISLTFPMLSGILLSFFNNFTGYRILFGIVLALVLAALWASMHLAPLTNAYDGDTHTHFRDVIPQLLKSKPERSVMYMMIFNGIRTGTMTFLVNVLIYQIISSELLVGVNSFVGSILTIISAGAYGLIITVHRRQKSIFAASTCVIFCAVMLYFKMSPLTLIIFSAVNSGANIFISEPQTNLYFSLIQRIDGLKGHGAEVHTVNEFFLAGGRIIGIILTMLLPQNAFGSATAIIILTLSQYISAYFVGKVQQSLDEREYNLIKTEYSE